MPRVSRLFFRAAALFFLVGILMGLQMSLTGEFKVTGAHAHVSLLGWVSGAIFGLYFAQEPEKADTRLALVQFWMYVVASVVMVGSLYLLLRGSTALAPLVAAGSVLYAAVAVVFAWIVFLPDQVQTTRTGQLSRG